MSEALSERLESTFWRRHSNPKSGWSRVPLGAAMVYAIYQRDGRLLLAALVWTALNPLLFAPPETEDAWMTRAVLAERWWIHEEHHQTIGPGYPNICNTVAAFGFCYALYAAWRQRPTGAALGTATSIGLKLWWLRVLVQRYDAQKEDGSA